MNHLTAPLNPSMLAVEAYQPNPGALYFLEAAAHLASASRRSILIYCRAGLLRPLFLPPYAVMAFTEEEVYRARQIEEMRTAHGVSLPWIRTMFALLDDLARLRAEVRFLRKH